MRNFTLSDRSIPFPINTKGCVEVRHIGKIEGKKAFIHIYTFKFIGEGGVARKFKEKIIQKLRGFGA